MIVTRTPLRISFVGGGTDLPSFYRKQAGAVVSMAVNRYFYLSMHRYFEESGFLLKYSKTEKARTTAEIEHRIIRSVFSTYGIDAVDFASAADVPAGTGLGSSSAFTVGLIQLVNTYLGQYKSQRELAQEACHVEINRLGDPIGKQDQYGCAFGGLKFIQFLPDDTVVIEPIYLPPDARKELEQNLFLFYLGTTREAASVLADQKKNTEESEDVFEILSHMADQAFRLKNDILVSVDAVGHYLREGWEAKKKLSALVSNPSIDEACQTALSAGAVGVKVLGAGGGGFLLAYVKEPQHAKVAKALQRCPVHKVKIDASGSVVIFDDRFE